MPKRKRHRQEDGEAASSDRRERPEHVDRRRNWQLSTSRPFRRNYFLLGMSMLLLTGWMVFLLALALSL